MDFDEAVRHHASWKFRMSVYLRQPDGSMKPEATAADDACDLGRWILRAQAQLGPFPDFVRLRASHAAFHRAAADLVRRANAGERLSAEAELGSDSDYTRRSADVVEAILALKRRDAESKGQRPARAA